MTRPTFRPQRLGRRAALLGLAGAATLGRSSLSLARADTPNRLVVVILRGAMDGMGVVQPYGDPDLRRLRGPLVLPEPGQPNGLIDLGGFFGLHPALPTVARLYQAGAALPVHAIAGPARTRSHFDSQDLLEMGADHRIDSGWLNRAAGLITPSPVSETALAMGPIPPMLLRGPEPVGTYVRIDQPAPPAFFEELLGMHADDPLTRAALIEGLKERGFTEQVLKSAAPDPQRRGGFPALARIAGQLLADPQGPRLAALENADGWDTHGNQINQLAGALRNLDAGIEALQDGLGEAWARTMVLVVTEFGRTARVNGSSGTDHGTASVAFLLGGAVAGGRVRADWPGLADRTLFENRDLQPTADLRALAKGVLAAQFGLDSGALETVFPGSRAAEAMQGLLRA